MSRQILMSICSHMYLRFEYLHEYVLFAYYHAHIDF